MAVFGPDGAGKSAVIKRLTQNLSPPFHAIQQFHFRPMFRRQWSETQPVTDPHARLPRCGLISVFKLLYWLADCWCGYLFSVRPARAAAQIVIFDRYLDDILIDPRRYRLPKSSLWFARLVVQVAPRPDLYLLLDVPSGIVQQRKAEVPPAESRRQRLDYLQMFRGIPDGFIVNASISVEEVAAQVRILVLQSRTERSVNRAEVSLLADF